MKKLSIALLIASLLISVFAVTSFASAYKQEVVDLSQFDDDTLVELLKQVQTEIVDRRIEKTAHLIPATYIIGEDIPAGKYYLRKSDDSDGYGDVGLGTLGEEPVIKLDEYVSRDEDFEAFITAEDGDVLYLEIPCELTISAGIIFQ